MLDHWGVELCDIDEATRRAREIAASEASKGVPLNGVRIIVDDGSETFFELPFEAVAS